MCEKIEGIPDQSAATNQIAVKGNHQMTFENHLSNLDFGLNLVDMHRVICFALALTLLNSARAQVSLSDYNHLAAPKRTEVLFSFPDTIKKPIKLKMVQPNILDFISYVDTTIDPGTKECLLTLNLEAPRIFPIEVDSNYSHIFLVPGVRAEVIFSSAMDGNHLNTDNDHYYIEKYYIEKYRVLGVKRTIQEAFQFTQNYPDLKEAVRILDSISLHQHNILTKFEDEIPSWFVRYEKKNIDYTSLLYKLSVAYNLVYNNLLSFDNDLIQTLVSEVNISDEEGILTPFYVQCLGLAAKLKYCDSGCISLDDQGIISRNLANLRYIQELDGDNRKALVTQILVLVYNSTGTLPDSVLLELESEVASSDYRQRLEKHKNPDLANRAAPNFYLKDTNDKFHSLKDFKGNTILLNFWFVGCKPCHQEIPFEKRLVQELLGTSFQLINICMISDEDAWKNLVEREELPGTNLFANENWTEKISKEYNIIGYPRYVLVDQNGIVIDGKCRRPSNSELVPFIKEYMGN